MPDTESTAQSPAGASRRPPEDWTATDSRGGGTVRVLGADAVEKAGSDHPAMSLTPYRHLFVTGYGLELDHLKARRPWGSPTPGHPEYRRTADVIDFEWFAAQDQSDRDPVRPPSVRARVAVEAGSATPWDAFVGDDGELVSLEHHGASADCATLVRESGFTPEAVVAAARKTLATVAGNQA